MYVLADSKSLHSVYSKMFVRKGTLPTEVVLNLLQPISGTKRNITTDNDYTSVSLAKEFKFNKLFLVGAMKEQTMHSFKLLTKADAISAHYPYDHANGFDLLCIAPKRNKRVVFLSTMHAMPPRNKEAGIEEINVSYRHEKGSVDSHDQMCALYTTARKTNCGPMSCFLWNRNSCALNAYLIFTYNVPVLGQRDQTRDQNS